MNIRTRGRRLTARLAKLEQRLTGRPKTMHYIFYDDEGAYEVLTSRPGKGTETSYLRDPPEEEKGDRFGSEGGE